MELSPEDALRINVLLASPIEAVRIDESSMTVHALSGKGEARVRLNPNCRDETYLRTVREALSSHVLGSPGGYPVYLKRWTRMGQARDEILESLLLLGEPEAVVAVVNAGGLTDEIARRAWWTVQSAENARCMLRQRSVVEGDMGPVLAEFLVEFLPFEEEAGNMIDSVRLVLQTGLISAKTRQELWDRGRSRNAYYVGFLRALPDALPDPLDPHPAWEETCRKLAALIDEDDPHARQLCRLMSAQGQTFLGTIRSVLKKPSNQDVIVSLLHAISAYFESVRPAGERSDDIEGIVRAAETMDVPDTDSWLIAASFRRLIEAVPEHSDMVKAMLAMSMLDEPVVNPIFSRTDAVGSVMRKKLRPVSDPVHGLIDILTS
jgi:hypothetical protein